MAKYTIEGINENTYNILFSDSEKIKKEDYQSKEMYNAYATISFITKFRKYELYILHLLNFLCLRWGNIDTKNVTYDKTNNQFIYNDGNIIIPFEKFSSILSEIDYMKMKLELHSNKRYKKCHEKSLDLVQNILSNAKLLTGFVIINKSKILHSVVLIQRNNKEYIIDYINNLIIEKSKYEQLTNFTVLSILNNGIIEFDFATIDRLGIDIGYKSYLSFRNEIMSDINKKVMKL